MNETVVSTVKLTRLFGKTVAVQDLDLEVPAGSIFALLGPNGAGKTTTLRLLLGFLRPTSGRSTVFGLDSQRESCAIKRRVGYVAEGLRLYGWMRIREVVWFTSRFYPTWSDLRARELLDRFGLDPEAKARTLSRGQHAQVCLVLALAHDPDLLILDEATGGLDVLVRRQFPSTSRPSPVNRERRSCWPRTWCTRWSRSPTESPFSTRPGSSMSVGRRSSRNAIGRSASRSRTRSRPSWPRQERESPETWRLPAGSTPRPRERPGIGSSFLSCPGCCA